MKSNFTQQEILLITNNSFAQRQWSRKDNDDATSHLSPEENMEEICANGLIKEILPEVFKAKDDSKIYLWHIHPGFSFLQLELGEMPLTVESEFSLNPHNFLLSMHKN